ncbi:class I SAM-dependent methyltransferase [Microbacterium sp.]|uniref:class I SAM-dependent methyltransferase n=1 Tax=Microbacterium sp. TaxID=51671 RepID=UPI002D775725|nr:class I SAM-dependent methyltransferase [Microbacterium sp.]HET6300094.1 class I SAM-dependent methyltransferase [Microbacterium sp.]
MTARVTDAGRRVWNVNIHDDARLAAAVPAGARVALDVGCGDGFLAARLAKSLPTVVAVDRDEGVLERARARFPDARVEWRLADVFELAPAEARFDAVVSNATLHHLSDTRRALEHLGSLVEPGGVLGVVTFVRPRVRDLPWVAVAWVARGIAIRMRGKWEHTAPTQWPPKDTLGDLRRIAKEVLPGSTVKRLLYGRVMLQWRRGW